MKLMLPLTLSALLLAGQAMAAECTAPTNDINVPNGSKASKDEMLATQRAVKAMDAAVKEYGECLKNMQDAELAAAGDKLTEDMRTKIVAKYADRSNAEVDKLQKVVDKFNAELKAWRAKNPA